MEIKTPSFLETVFDNKVVYGLDQEWYHALIRQKAGCGPVAAATILLYRDKCGNGKLGYDNSDMDKAVKMLDDVWKYVRPGIRGLHKVENFVKGVHKLCEHYGLDWKCRYIKVDKNTNPDRVTEFMEAAIAGDCPVAFLNLHEGSIKAFDGWHWIVLIGIKNENGVYTAIGLDGGAKIEFDIEEWVKTTNLGGGFAYIMP